MGKVVDVVSEIEYSIVTAAQRLEDLKKALEEAKAMRFREGDVAFHKAYGNCIVVNVLIASYPRPGITNSRDNLTGYQIMHREGPATVKEKELIPITEMAKTLFSKS